MIDGKSLFDDGGVIAAGALLDGLEVLQGDLVEPVAPGNLTHALA